MRVVSQSRNPLEGGQYLPYFDPDPFEGEGCSDLNLAKDIRDVLRRTKGYSLQADLAKVDEAVGVLRDGGLFDGNGNIVNPHSIVSDFVLRGGSDPVIGSGYVFGPRGIAERNFVPSPATASEWSRPSQFMDPTLIGVVNFGNFLERLERAGHVEGRPDLLPCRIAHDFMAWQTSVFFQRGRAA